MKPVIGVCPLWDEKLDSMWMLSEYMDCVISSGGIPVVLPFTEDEESIDALADLFDGFLFTGGQDVDPSIYGEENSPFLGEISKERDGMEKLLIKAVIKREKPVFAICRGIQIINAVLGGSLYQDIPSMNPSDIVHRQEKPYDVPCHSVNVLDDTPLRSLLGKESIEVNSLHHQSVKDVAPSLKAMAVSADGITEGVYMPSYVFLLAVQWHPELLYASDEDSRKLFDAFVAACR